MGSLQSSVQLVMIAKVGPFWIGLPAGVVGEVVKLAPPPHHVKGIIAEPLGPLMGCEEPGEDAWGFVCGTRAFRVDSVDLVDVHGRPFFNMPPGLGVDVPELFRGVQDAGNQLVLEVRPEILAQLAPPRPRPPQAMALLETPVARALVFTASGHSLAFPLAQVLSVINKPSFSRVPRLPGGHAGLLVHAQTLYPVFDLGLSMFGRPSSGEMGVLAEVDGMAGVVLADAVRGVRESFRRVADGGGWMEDSRGERALFPLLRPASAN